MENKQFVVIMMEDNTNYFDMYAQTKVLGIRDNLNDARLLMAKKRNEIVNDIEDNETEYEITTSDDEKFINIYDEDQGIYYNIMIKEA